MPNDTDPRDEDSAELSIEDLEAVARAALLDETTGGKSLHGIGNGSF
jgi:hypothetical protein